MAEVLRELPARKRGRPPKYAWPLWLDGSPRRLERARDFPAVKDAATFRMMVYNAAKRQRPPVKVHVYIENEDTLVIQAWGKR